jgi:hypothetical protein
VLPVTLSGDVKAIVEQHTAGLHDRPPASGGRDTSAFVIVAGQRPRLLDALPLRPMEHDNSALSCRLELGSAAPYSISAGGRELMPPGAGDDSAYLRPGMHSGTPGKSHG